MAISNLRNSPEISKENKVSARPFLKWVGGKGQLIAAIDSQLPQELKDGRIDTYIEPFAGGGALLFHIAQTYPVSKFILSDNNADLIQAYLVIKHRVEELIVVLHQLETKYLKLNEERREKFYYKVRTRFNDEKLDSSITKFSDELITHAADLIFLNRTCFNGLFRVNSSGLFNVAFGRYDNPRICDRENLLKVSTILSKATVLNHDFEDIVEFVSKDSFVYLDPPYRPLTLTANFTAYSATTFTALDQQRLAHVCELIGKKKAKFMISNSDPSNIDPDDRFFREMYPNYRIEKTSANRMVNCRADKRGKVSELMIMNY
jgi:DNA adenine methylase